MSSSYSTVTENWTPAESATIIGQINQSDASSELSDFFVDRRQNEWPAYKNALIRGNEEYSDTLLTLTDSGIAVSLSEPGKLFAELKVNQATARSFAQEIELRIQFLKSEGEVLKAISEQDFRRFMDSLPLLKKPRIFLLDSGHLRAVWKGEQGEQIGLQFMGSGIVQYVIFAKHTEFQAHRRGYGRDTIEGVLRHISAFETEDLISV